MVSQYQNPISVPIRIDALWSDGTTNLAPPTADFSRLQKSVIPTSGNASNTQPWLGDTVRPAADDPYTLAAGLHLHWTLPQALRHGTTVYVLDYTVYNELVQQGVPYSLVQALQSQATTGAELTLDQLNALLTGLVPASTTTPVFQPVSTLQKITGLLSSDTDVAAYSIASASLSWDPVFLQIYGPLIVQTCARMKLPPVPNRWLVVRAEGTSGTTAWVVASDSLSTPQPDGSAPPGAGPTAIPGQFSSEFVQAMTLPAVAQAFQFLGQVTSADNWSETSSPAAGTVFAPLTAAGHGVPDFAAFYPNCQGVFGFWDSSADQETQYTYTVIGWFSDASSDPASPDYAVTPWSNEASAATRIAKLNWDVAGSPDWTTIDGSIYTAQISVTGTACEISTDIDFSSTVNVAIGNTAGEALAAYLAGLPAPTPQGGTSDPTSSSGPSPIFGMKAETVLDAAQAGVLRDVFEADGPAMIENTLHQQAFQAVSGGSLWHVVPAAPQQPGLGAAPQAAQLELSDAVAQALNDLNAAQMQFDRTQAYLRSQRQLLFTDWCRNLHLATDTTANNTNAFPNGGTANNAASNQIGLLAADILNQTAQAVDAAGMGNNTYASMLPYRAAKALYLAHAAAASALSALPAASDYLLKRRPAPRFWRPNDPVVLMSDAGGSALQATPASALPTTPVSGVDCLVCTVVTPGSGAPGYLPSPWAAGPSAACIAAAVSQATAVSCAQSWRPLSLLWQATYSPYPGVGGIGWTITTSGPSGPFTVQDYDTDFITGNFIPDPAGIDLIANTGAVPDTSTQAIYDGRVVLSSHATQTLRDRILRLAGQDPATTPPPATLEASALPGPLGQGPAATLLTDAYAQNPYTLSQALDGFHDRLLMLRRIPQVNVFDPGYAAAAWNGSASDSTWDPYSQSFYVEIGTQGIASPRQDDVYNPIRAGQCSLSNLQVVDAFGQTRTWAADWVPNATPPNANTTIAATLPNQTAQIEDAAPAFLLPPRLAQPARLLFRWIAADGSGDVESNQHPATSPVCGWLALNRVDETILVFEKDGTLVGWIPAGGGSLVAWAGGSGTIGDPFLQQVATQAEVSGCTLYDDIATALLTIEPRAHRQHTARSVLVSRPLALACTALRLETLGTPAPHQGYEWLATVTVDGYNNAVTDPWCPVQAAGTPGPASPFVQRETCGFTAVQFPVRLGDVSMDDDGLVAYWNVTASATGPTLAASYCLVDSDPATQGGAEPTIPLVCDPGAPPALALLLLDPRAPVHATSGILPTKDITIPPDMYRDAIRNMEYCMTVGPVLTPPDRIAMPIPAEARGPWSWAEEPNGVWNVVTQGAAGTPAFSGKVDDRAHLMTQPPVIREGWLQVNPFTDSFH